MITIDRPFGPWPPSSRDSTGRTRTWPVALAVVVLTAGAAALRFWGLAFGLPASTMARPDEEAITATAAQIVLHGPNPRFFDYPTLFMYAVALVERFWPGGPPLFDDAVPTMIARTLAASLGALSVPLLFLAARTLFSVSTASIAAALLAGAFLHVRDSHFGVTDVPMTFMVLAAFVAIVSRRLDRRHGWNLAAAAILCGLATSTKYNALVICAPLAAVMAMNRNPPWTYALAFAGVAAGFLAGTPYALIKGRYFPRGASIYQNGSIYGRVKPWPEGLYPEVPLTRGPRLAIVHSAWLVAYNDRPAEVVDERARHYRLLRRIDVENRSSATVPVFDQQDAFFVPVSGFDRFVRPGPTIEIYERVAEPQRTP